MFLFDDSIAAAFQPLPPFGCHECGHDSPSATKFYTVQSAKKCGTCLQLGYHQVEWCEGQSCESENMFHTKCMTKINESWFCDSCVAAGAVAYVGSDEDGFDKDDKEVEDADETSQDAMLTESDTGWPSLETHQQRQFQEWYTTELTKRQTVITESLENCLQQAEKEQERGDASEARQWIDKARDLQNKIREQNTALSGEPEQLRQACWRFVRETESVVM